MRPGRLVIVRSGSGRCIELCIHLVSVELSLLNVWTSLGFGTVTKVLMLCTTVSHQWAVPDTDFPVDQSDSCKALDRCSTCQLASMMQFPKAYCLTCFYCNLNGQENCFESRAVFPM